MARGPSSSMDLAEGSLPALTHELVPPEDAIALSLGSARAREKPALHLSTHTESVQTDESYPADFGGAGDDAAPTLSERLAEIEREPQEEEGVEAEDEALAPLPADMGGRDSDTWVRKLAAKDAEIRRLQVDAGVMGRSGSIPTTRGLLWWASP